MKNWVKRAIRTFIQAAVSYLLIAIPALDFEYISKATVVGVVVSTVAAAISAVWNLYEDYYNDKYGGN